jgi:hypothetical protein
MLRMSWRYAPWSTRLVGFIQLWAPPRERTQDRIEWIAPTCRASAYRFANLRLSMLLTPLLLASAAAAMLPSKQPSQAPLTSRRAALSAFAPLVVAPLVAPLVARADPLPREGGALAATCMGFGCNPYSAVDFNGLPKEAAPAGSMPYPDFLAALKAKKVEGVIFQPPAGDVYAAPQSRTSPGLALCRACRACIACRAYHA